MPDITFEYSWSTTEGGDLAVDLVDALGRPVAGAFVFDEATLLNGLEDDLADVTSSEERGDVLIEWLNVADNLLHLSEVIREKLKTTLN